LLDDPFLDDIKRWVPHCLNKLLLEVKEEDPPSKRIPIWLSEVIKLKSDSNHEDFDVDIDGLFKRIMQEALSLLDGNNYQEAKTLLKLLLDLNPKNPLVLYNLACTESLLKNCDEAFELLQAAIESGYHNLAHLSTDPDLENLRKVPFFHPKYQNLLSLITSNPDTLSIVKKNI